MWMKLEEKDLGPVADPLPYLYRMANNLMLDRYRSATRRERREQDWAEGAGGVMADPSEDVAVDERLILNERLEEARAVLQSRSEEHTSELQSLMRISYAVFCLKKKKNPHTNTITKLTKQHKHRPNTTNTHTSPLPLYTTDEPPVTPRA